MFRKNDTVKVEGFAYADTSYDAECIGLYTDEPVGYHEVDVIRKSSFIGTIVDIKRVYCSNPFSNGYVKYLISNDRNKIVGWFDEICLKKV